jgi:hypothetical protein
MKEIKLAGKKVLFDKSPVVFSYNPDENWKNYVDVKSGNWYYEDGAIIGFEPGNKGGIAFLNKYFENDVMLSFTVSTVLPATRDLNAVWAANWDDEEDYLGSSYVCGLNGWWENKAGIERNKTSNLYSTTSLYKYTPGAEVRMTCGSINGHCFMVVDDVLVTELIDPSPIKGGYAGFSAYCTKLRIKDIEVREIVWEEFKQEYTPQFEL